MNFSDSLKHAILDELSHQNPAELSLAAGTLTKRYRSQIGEGLKHSMLTDLDRYAYLAYRMPATYAVLLGVFEELSILLPEFSPKSLLDLGSGPGTALWAASAIFPSLQTLDAFEQDSSLIAIGKHLASRAPSQHLQSANWHCEDLKNNFPFQAHEMVTLSYAIGELSNTARENLIERAWKAASDVLLVVEPGTPAGFECIRSIRSFLVASGARILAPCTHQNACPMQAGDWCHFSRRLERSQIHRYVKNASLGHEDEKFSYIAVTKRPFQPKAIGRVLRTPEKHSGHMSFSMCTAEGLVKAKFSKRDKEEYKSARKLEWGDLYP